jgi:hypothetical protein
MAIFNSYVGLPEGIFGVPQTIHSSGTFHGINRIQPPSSDQTDVERLKVAVLIDSLPHTAFKDAIVPFGGSKWVEKYDPLVI